MYSLYTAEKHVLVLSADIQGRGDIRMLDVHRICSGTWCGVDDCLLMAVTCHLFCFISSAILSYLISAARRGRGPRPSQFMRGKARSESGEAGAGDWVIANSKFQWSSVYWSQTQQTVHIMEPRIFWWRVKGSGVLICSPSNQIISSTCPPFSSPKVSISAWKLELLFIPLSVLTLAL